MLSCTKTVIKRVEEATGREVRVLPDPALTTMATVKMARGDDPFHLVVFNPNGRFAPDYFICYQCGFILRLFGNPPEQRFDFKPSAGGEQAALKLVRDHHRTGLSDTHARQLATHLFNGVLIQLRSYPVGFRVDSALRQEFPEVVSLQDAIVRQQLQDNLQVLAPDIRKTAPAAIYTQSVGMNAAFAEYWAGVWHEPPQTVPYGTAGYRQTGLDLLDVFLQTQESPSADRTLIDRWAQKLGLDGWYNWVPYRLSPARKK